ncbi:class-II fumarase/aspartase family protein [Chachezhania sediminis]|uniref:class-II fumarase/aspartase family protein n=1 Tax=Chachezhania sediminis TaxID=2599291 RepID=UPI00131DED3D|nr:adenylosuccinate lyase family protein [Chachezhania sediminis]
MSLASTAPGLLSQTQGYLRAMSVFGEAGTVDAYLQFEAALAEVQGRLGIIPAEAAAPVAAACRSGGLDLDLLRVRSATVGYPIAPLVEMVAEKVGPHGQWVHYGATTQDAMDTGQVLQLRAALGPVLADLDRTVGLLADLCARHRHTPMAGRSKLQHGVPITFGYKVAVWLDQIARARDDLAAALDAASVLQFGGAVGTLASLRDRGMAVRQALAERLDLTEPDISWHVSRDRMARLTGAVAAMLAALGRMAVDIAHMMSTEVGELAEPAAAGRGSSSTMPQKRNPVICEAMIEAARTVQGAPAVVLDAMLQEHERGLGHGYRERMAICDATAQLAGAATLSAELLAGLEVNVDRMRANLDLTGGLIHSEAAMIHLSEKLGRLRAHAVLHEVAHRVGNGGAGFEAALAEVAGETLPPGLTDAAAGTDAAAAMIDRVLARIGGAVRDVAE